MQKLDEIIEIYLKMDTNYALMITGEWGVGKTHYYKNVLTPKISLLPVFNNNSKKYKPILISLFGLKSLEEIQSAIFLNLFPFLKNKKVKISASLSKLIAKGILYYKGLGEYSGLLDEINAKNGSLFINTEDIVICFDDLERISPNLHLEEFIGYVNSLVESENIKVLIIANQDKIEEPNFSILKEKVIGNSIEFIPTLDESFAAIINEKFSQSKQYIEFLKANKEFIVKLFSSGSSNLRTLIFLLNYFQTVFSEVSIHLFFHEEKILNEKKDEIILDLLKFSIAISIEYKLGNLSFNKRIDLDNRSFLDLPFDFTQNLNAYPKTKEEAAKSERQLFQEKYYHDVVFNFYGSIYDYLTGGDSFNYNVLVDDLKKIHHIKDNVVMPHYEAYDKLKYPNCFSLGNRQYIVETKKMLHFAFKGSYDLEKCLNIFHFATRFNNPLNLEMEKLIQKLIRGLKLGKNEYKYNRDLDFDLRLSNNSEYKQEAEQIKKAALEINEEILKNTNTKKYLELQKKCYSDFEKFNEEVLNQGNISSFEPFFSGFNPAKFYSFFYSSSPARKWQIVRFFEIRYKEFRTSDFKIEIDFLTAIQRRLKKMKGLQSGKNVSGFVFLEFEKILTKTIQSLEN